MDAEVRGLLTKRKYNEALERLLDLYQKKVFGMAVMMLRDAGRAEEVTQEVFLKVWRALPAYDGRAAVSTWLYAIARNTCLTAVRSESYRKATDLERAPEPRVSADAALHVDLAACLSRLPEILREVITLFYLQEKSIKEVAAILDLPEGTVKSHLHRARRALSDMME